MALFGTDGVRGVANVDLTAELAVDLAIAAAHVLGEIGAFLGHRPKAIVAQDSRASGDFLESAVVAGLTSAGVDVYRVGVLPTPAVAFLVKESNADLGVMISASHNPMPDNGIKFFAKGGDKLADQVEAQIEARLGESWNRPTGLDVGRIFFDESAKKRYIDHLLSTMNTKLTGLKVVVDCANGAASTVAPSAYEQAGAMVTAISATPTGWNINENCGSTHLDNLINEVKKRYPTIQEVWLVGTSMGTISSSFMPTYAPRAYAGAIHTAAITEPYARNSYRELINFDYKKSGAPQFFIHHKDDPCYLTTWSGAKSISDKYGVPLITVFGGSNFQGNPCNAFTEHGFRGKELEVMQTIREIILTGTSKISEIK